MLKTILVILAILLLCSTVYADAPLFVAHQVIARPHTARAASVGSSSFDYGPSGIRFSYLYDGNNGGLAVGVPVYALGNFHLDPIGSYEPTNGNQVAIGFVLAYDIKPIKDKPITISPMIGGQKPIVDGNTGGDIRAVYGFTLKVGF